MKYSFLTAFLTISSLVFAQKSAQKQDTSAKPVAYLSAKDTCFFTIDEANEKFIEHTVRSKQTLFSMAKFYGLSLEELYEFNPEFRTEPTMKVGQVVRISLPNASILRYKTKDFTSKKYAPLVYRVRPGETLFNLCKRQFRMPVDSILKRNKLKTSDLRVGQRILMGWISVEGIKAEDRAGTKPAPVNSLKTAFENEKKKVKAMTASGTAFWQKDSNEKGDLYALHRSAKIGSIMLVTNSATNKSVYVKVIGRVPQYYEKNTEVILSPAAARATKAMDSRFLVQLKFYE